MAITIVGVFTNVNNGSSPTIAVTTDGLPIVGDLLYIIHGNDFFDITNMVAPTVAPGAPVVSPVGVADNGNNNAHAKTYFAYVNTPGAQTVSTTETGGAGEDKGITVYVLRGAAASNPIDDVQVANGGPAASISCPSATATLNDDLFITHINSGTGATLADFTTPAPMVERYEWHTPTFCSVGATQQLVASGATGVRTFTPGTVPWVAVSTLIKTAAAGPATVELTPASFTFSGVPVSPVPGLATIALTPASFHFSAVRLGLPGAPEGPDVSWCASLAPNWNAELAPNWSAHLVEECI